MKRAGLEAADCHLISDGEYIPWVEHLVHQARRRILVSMFIIDLVPRCGKSSILKLLSRLQRATWRGIDVRLLVGGSRKTFAIAEASQIAASVCASKGIVCKWLTGERNVRGSHAKMVIADNHVLVGSHNWSERLGNETQDSVLIHSKAIASNLAREFEKQWTR